MDPRLLLRSLRLTLPLRKWVPKFPSSAYQFPSPIPPSISIPRPNPPSHPMVPSIVLDLPIATLVSVLSKLSDVWFETDKNWIDLKSNMRYNPVDDSSYRFVPDNCLDLRCLNYCTYGDSLVLAMDGQKGNQNVEMLSDSYCDRSFIYSSASMDYDSCLAALFRPFARIIGKVPLDSTQMLADDGVSSSFEETHSLGYL